MKKTLIIIITMLLISNINAQSKFNLNLSYSNYIEGGLFLPIGISIEPSNYITDKLSILTGLNVFYKRQVNEGIIMGEIYVGPIKENNNYAFFGIPVIFKYKMTNDSRFGIYTKFGIKNYMKFLFVYGMPLGNGENGWETINYGYSINANLGLGFQYKINDKFTVFIETNAEYLLDFMDTEFYLDSKLGVIIPIK